MRIHAFHLLNNYTGSPRVLSQLVKVWMSRGIEVHITTSQGGRGFLSNIPGVVYHANHYRFFANPLLRALALWASQAVVFIGLLLRAKPSDTVYINTMLPFAAALAGKAKRCRVIYHLHETSTRPAILGRFLMWVVRIAATDVVYVSSYLANARRVQGKRTYVIPSCIADDFYATAKGFNRGRSVRRNVLMVSSLKAYKGVNDFIALAKQNPHLRFRLVLSVSGAEAALFAQRAGSPANMEVLGVTDNLHPHYQWADVVLNLSHPDRWVETLGLTVLEGMVYGLPAVVPPVGGVLELVEEGVNGYRLSVAQADEISRRVNHVLSDDETYRRLSAEASARAEKYRETDFCRRCLLVLSGEPA